MTVRQKPGIIGLSRNENPFGPSPRVVRAIEKNTCRINRYPDASSFELRDYLAGLHGLDPGNYIFGAGSNEVIDIFLQAVLRRGDRVLAFFPSFPQYRLLAEKQGGVMQEVPLEGDFSFDVNEFLLHADNAKVLFLCNPNNPTGSLISRREILKVLEQSAYVVLDEAYAEFLGETFIGLVEEYANLIVLRSFSKAYGLAGMRVGYGVAGRVLVEKMMKVKSPFNVGLLAQKSALAALSDVRYLKKTVDLIVSEREYLSRELRIFFTVYPSDANFLWVDVRPLDAYAFARGLLEQNISVMPFGQLPGYSGSYVRISVGTREQNRRLIAAIGSFVSP